MARLRAPDGCPWDRRQTYRSLREYLLEETYEALEAIDRGDYAALEAEIGDLLFEAVFLAQIAAEEGRFTVADSLAHVVDKLVRRHPHVFGARPASGPVQGDAQAAAHPLTPDAVVEQWERIKAREQHARGERPSVLGGVGRSLPALLRAHEIGRRAAAVGFDWPDAPAVLEKVHEEIEELGRAIATEGDDRIEEELGDLLFAVANLARKLGVEPESALRRANEKFTERFEALERRLAAQGRSIHEASLEEMERIWQALKKRDRGS
jgi:MazG family protein